MARRIKPYIDEISLAFNPANKKKFHMRKDENKFKKGGSIMPKAVEILESKDGMFKEAEFNAFLDTLGKDQLTDENRELVMGSFKLLGVVKDQLPKGFIEGLVKAIPELKPTFTIVKTEKVNFPADETKIRKEIEAELRKEMKLEKDQAVVKLEGEIETFKKELKTTIEALDKEREIRELAEIRTFIKEKNVPGDIEKTSRTLLLARRANPELGKDIETMLKSTGEALTAAGIFSELGKSSDGPAGGRAWDKLQAKVAEVMGKDTKLEQHKAWEKIIKENSELYKEYTADRAVETKEVH